MKLGRRKTRGLLCSGLLLLTLQACESQTQTAGISGQAHAGFCDVARPITFSRLLDTAATIEQVKEHNAVGASLCGWAP